MRSNFWRSLLFFGSIFLIAQACGFSGGLETPATPPTAAVEETDAAPHIALLISQHVEERGEAPLYRLNADIPYIQNSQDPRVVAFNQQINTVVQEEIGAFHSTVDDLPTSPVSAGSFFDLRYQLLSPPGDVLSLKLTVDIYMDGAAHPYAYTRVFNYNLLTGQGIGISQLFIPGSDYLGRISEYCKGELRTRDIAYDDSNPGANPTLENYANWNITPDGLLITFDMYQVAPYAAGPQLVIIPYSALNDLIAADGPLAFTK